MARTKIRQLVQIDNTQAYNDGYSGMNTGSVAEAALGDGSLEQDLNILRSLMKQEKGAVANWYTAPANTLSNLNTGTGLAGTSAPVYSSALNVTQNESLTAAAGHLDQYLGNVKGGFSGDAIISAASATTAKTALDALDAYSVGLSGQIAALSVTAGDGMTQSGSLQAGTLTFDVVGTANQITALANSVKVADAFSKTDFTSFTVSTSSGLSLDGAGTSHLSTSAGTMSVSAAAGALNLDGAGASHLSTSAGTMSVSSSAAGLLLDGAGNSHLTTSSGTMVVSAAGNVILQNTNVQVSPSGKLTVNGANDLQYTDGNQAANKYLVSDASGNAAWATIQDTQVATSFSGTHYLDGYTNEHTTLVGLDSVVFNLGQGSTLQGAYNQGYANGPAVPDIQVNNNDNLDVYLGTGTSAFTVRANDGSQTLRVTDGYVQIDGYLSVTGSTVQINSTVTDADHWLIQPGLAATVALEVMPQVSSGSYTADLLDMYDGYNGTLQVKVDHTGKMTLNKAFQLTGNGAAAGRFLESDASGNATWVQVTTSNVNTAGLTSTNYISNGTTDSAALSSLDAELFSVTSELAATAFVNGAGTTASGALGGNVTFNVGVIAGQTKIVGQTVGIADAFNKTDFSSITATASGAVAVTGGASSTLTTSSGTMTVSAAGNVQLQSSTVTVSPASKLAVTTGANSFQYQDGNQAANKYLVSDASGNAAWATIQDTQVATSFSGTNFLDADSNVHTSLLSLDSEIGTLSITAGNGMTQTGSLQAGTLTFDVVGTANQITSNANSIQIANAFSKTDYTTYTVQSSSGLLMDGGASSHLATSAGTMTVTGASDAYFAGVAGETKFKDQRSAPTSAVGNYFRLSSSTAGGADFLATLRTAAAALGYLSAGATGELGIIDAINTVYSAGGGGAIEKSIFVIGASDGRLSSTGGGLTSNILSLNVTGGGPDRGSLELTPSVDGYGSDFRPARDLEVHVNGILQLADANQKSASGSPSDDYFLASDNDKLVFNFTIKPGDVVTVTNHKAAPGEDLDTGWNSVV